MKRLITIAVIGFGVWQGYQRYQINHPIPVASSNVAGSQRTLEFPSSPSATDATSTSEFNCDGRTYCSQMTSCSEATFFLKNCPGVKMDGDHDGVPCEQQWCK